MNIAIIGGGAAGFFCAIHIKEHMPQARVVIFERQPQVLRKVKVSGGGRCNVTNSFEGITDLKQVYPRGHKLLKRLFCSFDHQDAYHWFESHGVPLTTQEDHCVFPAAQDSQRIIDCFVLHARKYGILIKTSHRMTGLRKDEAGYLLEFEKAPEQHFDKVVITTGGSPRIEGLRYLQSMGHEIMPPVPSLFTFTITDRIRDLMGIVVDPVSASIPGTRYKSNGALLITHWGMSGPAILKLSSHAARHIHDADYQFPLQINWTNDCHQEEVATTLQNIKQGHSHKQLSSIRPFDITSRLWLFLIEKAGLTADKRWSEVGPKQMNRLINILCNDTYRVEGKGTFREEFVTCGGISTSSVHPNTLESKSCPGLYFAGELLDIDGITGGFNFQAAWTTGFTVAKAIIDGN